MWYKHFNKDSWALRIWRNKNLTFLYNDMGIGSNFYVSKFTSMYRRLFPHEGPMRLFNMGLFLIGVTGYSYYSKTYLQEGAKKKQLQQEMEKNKRNQEEYKEFEKNRFGLATNPVESMEKFMKFIVNEKAIQGVSDFNANPDVTAM